MAAERLISTPDMLREVFYPVAIAIMGTSIYALAWMVAEKPVDVSSPVPQVGAMIDLIDDAGYEAAASSDDVLAVLAE